MHISQRAVGRWGLVFLGCSVCGVRVCVTTYGILCANFPAPFLRGCTNYIDLGSFLIKPVQRVMRYPLLLMELLGATPESHPDRAPLAAAVLAVKEINCNINESKRRKDLGELWGRGDNVGKGEEQHKHPLEASEEDGKQPSIPVWKSWVPSMETECTAGWLLGGGRLRKVKRLLVAAGSNSKSPFGLTQSCLVGRMHYPVIAP